MSYKETAVRYQIKVRVVNDLMSKLKKKPSYFVKETEKILKRNKAEEITISIIKTMIA